MEIIKLNDLLTREGLKFIKKDIEELEKTRTSLIDMQCRLKVHPLDEYLNKKINEINIKIAEKEQKTRGQG